MLRYYMEGICSVILEAWHESFAREPEHITMRQKMIYSRFSVRKFRKATGATYYETKDLRTFQVKGFGYAHHSKCSRVTIFTLSLPMSFKFLVTLERDQLLIPRPFFTFPYLVELNTKSFCSSKFKESNNCHIRSNKETKFS